MDGMDVRDLDVDAYRRQIGVVYQETFLFSNTVSANIAFGSPHATSEQISRAAGWPPLTISFCNCRRAMTPCWANRESIFREANANAWLWPGPFCWSRRS